MSMLPAADRNQAAKNSVRSQLELIASRPGIALPDLFRRVCETAAETLHIERVGVWLFVNGEKALRCVSLYERSKRKHTKGGFLHLTNFPTYLRSISSASLLACDQARSDPRTAELCDPYFTPNSITSVLNAPLLRDGRLIGLLCHEHLGSPRLWTDDERAFALGVADLVIEHMRAAEGVLRHGHNPEKQANQHQPNLDRSTGQPIHDLRNVFAEILAHAELIAMIPHLPLNITDRIARIAASADRGVALLHRLPQSTSNSDIETISDHQLTTDLIRPERAPSTTEDSTDEHPTLPSASTG